ncbi:hypothetical protein ACFY3M_11110 [Streptomyces mirabilis]|uniref:hypothetical protein n=1 Tax=Streptomyces mirabilis TaxID=68239 RepID=UPI0036B52A5A
MGENGTSLDALLAFAVRGVPVDLEAEGWAVAAYRAAREGGAHGARTRRRDDWRPREQRRPGREFKESQRADGNGRGRHPPQERPRPSRGTGRAATRTLYSAAAAFSVTPRCVTS